MSTADQVWNEMGSWKVAQGFVLAFRVMNKIIEYEGKTIGYLPGPRTLTCEMTSGLRRWGQPLRSALQLTCVVCVLRAVVCAPVKDLFGLGVPIPLTLCNSTRHPHCAHQAAGSTAALLKVENAQNVRTKPPTNSYIMHASKPYITAKLFSFSVFAVCQYPVRVLASAGPVTDYFNALGCFKP